MSRSKRSGSADPAPLPEPVDVVDGIPDRSAHAPAWKYVLIALLFLAWLAFLIYCAVAGAPKEGVP